MQECTDRGTLFIFLLFFFFFFFFYDDFQAEPEKPAEQHRCGPPIPRLAVIEN